MQSPESQRIQTIAALAPFAADHPELYTIIIYGSAVRGRLRRGGDYRSDLDIAVAASDALSLPCRISLAAELERLSGLDVDLVDLHSVHGGFLKEILIGGEALRRDREFIAQKYLEMYDHDLFLAPQLRAARERGLKRYFAS